MKRYVVFVTIMHDFIKMRMANLSVIFVKEHLSLHKTAIIMITMKVIIKISQRVELNRLICFFFGTRFFVACFLGLESNNNECGECDCNEGNSNNECEFDFDFSPKKELFWS